MTRRVTSIREFWNEVKPGDYARAVRNFSASEAQALCDWVKRNPRNWDSHTYDALMANNRRQVVYETKDFWGRYFRDNPEKYWQFLREMKIIEEPRLWRHNRNLTLSAIEQMLTPVPAPSYVAFGLGSEYNNREYSNAIKILQADIGCEVTGIYDQGTAIQLFRKKEIFIPKGKGYLAHEVNPNLLFDYRYEPQVYVVDRDLWQKMQFFYQDLTRDSNRDYWNNPPISSAVHGTVDEDELLSGTYEMTGRGLGATESTLIKKGEQLVDPVLKDVNDISIKTHHKVGDVFGALDVGFSMFSTADRMVQEGIHDPDAIVTEVVISGVEEVVIDRVTGKAVSFVLKVFFIGGGGAVYWCTAFALDYVIGKYLDDVAEGVKKFFREDFLPFMDRYSASLQANHERDMAAGIRLD